MGEEYDSSIRGNYITLKEASTLTPYSQEYLSLLARSGKIEAKKFGRNWRVRREVVERYYKEHQEDREKFGKPSRAPADARPSRRAASPRVHVAISSPKLAAIGMGWPLILLIAGYGLAQSPSPQEIRSIALREINNIHEATASNMFSARSALVDVAKNIYTEASDSLATLDHSLYEDSFIFGQVAKGSYLSANNLIEKSLTDAYINTANGLGDIGEGVLSDASSFALDRKGALEFSTASVFDPLTSAYGNVNRKITNFFGDRYADVVETVIPGYAPQEKRYGIGDEGSSQLAEELEKTKQDLKNLKEEGLVVKEVTKEVSRVTQVEPVREVTKETITVDDTKLLTIQGDVSKLQEDLLALQNSSSLLLASSRLDALEQYVLASNRTASVSTQNNTQLKYLLDNIVATSLELQTNSDRVGLLVNQKGTDNIVQFQDQGTDILTIQDGGATTLASAAFDVNATGDITLDTTGNAINFDSNTLYVDASNNRVGIATTTPTVSFAIDTTDAALLPVGTTAQRPTGLTGLIRFNTSNTTFEGYNGTNWAGLGGVIDVDQDTQILSELTPGSDDDTLFFNTAGTERMRITSTGLVGIGTTTPSTTLDIAGSLSATGQTTLTRTPSTAHTFGTWAIDTANSAVTDASFLINATSTVADSNLFGIAVAGNVKFLIDAEGDVFANGLTTAGSVTQGSTTISTLTVENNSTLGDASTDTLTFNADSLTIPNNFNIATSTLFIDSSNKRVGIGTTNPTVALDVSGALTVSGAVTITSGSITGITDLAVADGGTGASAFAAGELLVGAGTSAFTSTSTLAINKGGTGATTASAARTNLGLVIGTDVQAQGAVLDDFNALGAASADGEFIVATGAGAFAYESGDTARTSIGLGSANAVTFATLDTGQGANELYDMDQNVLTTSSPTFTGLTATTLTATTTLTINHTSSGDPLIQLQDAGTDAWYLGFDNSDANKFRLTPGGAFNATSSGLTVNAGGFLGIGTTNPTVALDVSGALTVSGAVTLSDALSVTGITTFSNTTTSFNGVSYGFPSADGTSGQALSTNGSGVLSWSQAGVNDATYITLSTNSSLTDERVLTGTANQITLTDNGAGGTIVISTPQDIATTSSPTFTALTATTTLTLNHTNSGDPYINFEDNATDTWYLGFDNSDSDKFRITPGGAFNATSSGITLDVAGNVAIGTTNPRRKLDVFATGAPQLRLTETDNTEYSDFQVAASTGDLTVSASGEDTFLTQDPAGTTGTNLWVCEGAACSSISISTRVNFITSGTTTTAWGSATDAGGNILPENAIIFDNEYVLIPATENATSVLMMFGPSSSTAPIIIFDQVVP